MQNALHHLTGGSRLIFGSGGACRSYSSSSSTSSWRKYYPPAVAPSFVRQNNPGAGRTAAAVPFSSPFSSPNGARVPAIANSGLRGVASSSFRSFSSAAGAASNKKTLMSVTPAAAARIAEIRQIEPEARGIRVGLRQRGCNGMSYVMDFQKDDPGKFDEIVPALDESGQEVGTVFVDSKAVLFLVGTEMDYVAAEMGSEFVFRNPNEKSTCGCGQSFNV